ncbi:MAG: transcriptional regulator [Firmicutes bacterium]|nr:transcriptional regulator [Bacillota bacterium]
MIVKQTRELDLSALLTPKPNKSSADYVVTNIKELLLTKKILPGEKLPSEMELTRLLSVSRGSVREAMKMLSALGIIEIKRGDGTYVSSNMDGKVLFDPLLFSFILTQSSINELKELRLLLEKDVIRLVVKNATDSDIQTLRDCHETMETLKNDNTKFFNEELLRCELEFHQIQGRITKNRLLEKIYNFVLEYFRPSIALGIEKHAYGSLESKETHKNILEAIEKRDIIAAEKAVESSVEVWTALISK